MLRLTILSITVIFKIFIVGGMIILYFCNNFRIHRCGKSFGRTQKHCRYAPYQRYATALQLGNPFPTSGHVIIIAIRLLERSNYYYVYIVFSYLVNLSGYCFSPNFLSFNSRTCCQCSTLPLLCFFLSFGFSFHSSHLYINYYALFSTSVTTQDSTLTFYNESTFL